MLLLAQERLPGLDASALKERLGSLIDPLPEDDLKNEVQGLLNQLAHPRQTD
jgi:hypothetical protein